VNWRREREPFPKPDAMKSKPAATKSKPGRNKNQADRNKIQMSVWLLAEIFQ
jgi:hypothetical protein